MPTKTATKTTAPTTAQYDNLQRAFDHFNRKLFAGKLRPVLFTLQRQARTFGYFWVEQFASKNQAEGAPASVDEIALNPDYFARPDCEVLSTLAHEMAHLWQQQYGKPGRGRYHNQEWADKMKAIGLQPTSTGLPGGKETGDHMTHLIIEGGPFATACAEFLKAGAAIMWEARSGLLNGTTTTTTKTKGGDDGDDGDGDETKAKKGTTRAKFTCPQCQLNAWAKPGARLLCGDCTDVDAGEAVEMEPQS